MVEVDVVPLPILISIIIIVRRGISGGSPPSESQPTPLLDPGRIFHQGDNADRHDDE